MATISKHRSSYTALGPVMVVVFTLVIVLVIAQLVPFTPVDPVRGTRQQVRPVLLWVVGNYGDQATGLSGNWTYYGSTLLLNSIGSSSNTTATWSIAFPVSYDLTGKPVNVTVWLPAFLPQTSGSTPLIFTSTNSSDIILFAAGEALAFQPVDLIDVSWWPSPLFTAGEAESSTLPQLYANFTGDYKYIPLSFGTSHIPATLAVTITVPAHAELWVPNLIISVAPTPGSGGQPSAQWLGWIFLSADAAVISGLIWLARRLWTAEVAWTLGTGIALQLGLAAVFLHTDLITLTQYPTLIYQYRIANLQSMVYGPAYFASLVLPPAPFYAAGLTPTTNTLNVLFKLTPIAFDGLTFLLLYRVLVPRIGTRGAYVWSTFGWLFNPVVVYVSAVHGLAESGVAFFLLLALYLSWNREWLRSSASVALATAVLYPAAFVIIPLAALRGNSVKFVLSLLVLPLLLVGAVYVGVYRTWQPISAYIQVTFATESARTFPAYGSLVSSQSPWALLVTEFGLYPNLVVAVTAVSGVFLFIRLWKRGEAQRYVAGGMVFSLVAFYLSYTNYSIQLVLWVLPILIVLLVLEVGPSRPAFVYVLLVGFFAVGVDLLWWGNGDTMASMVLFSLLSVPMLLLIAPTRMRPDHRGLAILALISASLSILAVVTGPVFFTSNAVGGIFLAIEVSAAVLLSLTLLRSLLNSPIGPNPRTLTLSIVGVTASLGLLYDMLPPVSPPPTGTGFALALGSSVALLGLLTWHVYRFVRDSHLTRPSVNV